MIASGVNLVMTVVGFTVSTMFIVFVCTRLICARIQLSAYRRSVGGASRSDLSILERGLHGLEPVVVENFPTKKYGDRFLSLEEDTQQTVCFLDFKIKEESIGLYPRSVGPKLIWICRSQSKSFFGKVIQSELG